MPTHLVRVGAFAQVGRFAPADAKVYPRGSRVIVRTDRGLEVGEVLAADAGDGPPLPTNGVLVRGMTVDDELLAARLERNRLQALEACQRTLEKRGLTVTLIDGETLFDGRGVYFYFLGEPPARLEALTAELADVFDAEVQFQAFAATLMKGCGPDCGAADHSGGHCTNCDTGCAVAKTR
jgi:cell fate regulator YaaT (PSP1 superfamily)